MELSEFAIRSRAKQGFQPSPFLIKYAHLFNNGSVVIGDPDVQLSEIAWLRYQEFSGGIVYKMTS